MASDLGPNQGGDELLVPSEMLVSPATDRSEPPTLPMDHFLNLYMCRI
jgi:hypothetical protein